MEIRSESLSDFNLIPNSELSVGTETQSNRVKQTGGFFWSKSAPNAICQKAIKAAMDQKHDVVDFLVMEGCLPSYAEVDENKNTLLHHIGGDYSNFDKYPAIVDKILKDPNVKDFINIQNVDGNTPLHIAAIAGNVDMARRLHEAGADLNIKNNGDFQVAALTVDSDMKSEVKSNNVASTESIKDMVEKYIESPKKSSPSHTSVGGSPSKKSSVDTETFLNQLTTKYTKQSGGNNDPCDCDCCNKPGEQKQSQSNVILADTSVGPDFDLASTDAQKGGCNGLEFSDIIPSPLLEDITPSQVKQLGFTRSQLIRSGVSEKKAIALTPHEDDKPKNLLKGGSYCDCDCDCHYKEEPKKINVESFELPATVQSSVVPVTPVPSSSSVSAVTPAYLPSSASKVKVGSVPSSTVIPAPVPSSASEVQLNPVPSFASIVTPAPVPSSASKIGPAASLAPANLPVTDENFQQLLAAMKGSHEQQVLALEEAKRLNLSDDLMQVLLNVQKESIKRSNKGKEEHDIKPNQLTPFFLCLFREFGNRPYYKPGGFKEGDKVVDWKSSTTDRDVVGTVKGFIEPGQENETYVVKFDNNDEHIKAYKYIVPYIDYLYVKEKCLTMKGGNLDPTMTETFLSDLLVQLNGSTNLTGGAKQSNKIKGTRKLNFVSEDAHYDRSSQLSRMITNQSNEIHKQVLEKIVKFLPKLDKKYAKFDESELEDVGRNYKAVLWQIVKQNKDLVSNLDQSNKLLELTTLKELKNINPEDGKKLREESRKRREERQKDKKPKHQPKNKDVTEGDYELSDTSSDFVPQRGGAYSQTSFSFNVLSE